MIKKLIKKSYSIDTEKILPEGFVSFQGLLKNLGNLHKLKARVVILFHNSKQLNKGETCDRL